MAVTDFDHIGPICRRIRERMGIDPSSMARACGYKGRDIAQAIRRFENGYRNLSGSRFQRYLTTLGLSPEKTTALRNMYHSHQKRDIDEFRLGLYSFRTIVERRYSQLADLVEQLKVNNSPSLIQDELFYVHAVNAPCLALYQVAQAYLSSPAYWHTVATKFHPNPASPVRTAYRMTEQLLYNYETMRFFQATSRYLFTKQLTDLVHFLDKVSLGRFGDIWLDLVTMSHMLKAQDQLRAFNYNGQQIVLSAQLQHPPTTVEIMPNHTLQYSLMSFSVVGEHAHEVHQDISKASSNRAIEFAYEYVPDYNEIDWLSLT